MTKEPDTDFTPERDDGDGEVESLTEKLKGKVENLFDAPEAADYDTTKTNPVTGQRRDP